MYVPTVIACPRDGDFEERVVTEGPECATFAGALGYISRVGGADLAQTIETDELLAVGISDRVIVGFCSTDTHYAEITRV